MFETEELVKNHYLEDANTVFLKGAKGGLRGTDEIYDLLIEEDCKAGDHSNALTVAYQMEASGRMATTFHFNCLLSVQVSLQFFFLEYAGELCIIALRRRKLQHMPMPHPHINHSSCIHTRYIKNMTKPEHLQANYLPGTFQMC